MLIAVGAKWFFSGHFLVSDSIAGDNKLQDSSQLTIDDNLKLGGYVYKCANMVRLVNHLRGLGKDDALAALKQHMKKNGLGDEKVVVICRCLFQNSKDWGDPDLGGPDPDVSEKASKAFPAFPVAFSRKVPFFLVGAYSSTGISGAAIVCLDKCKSLPLIDKDLPTEGYAEAAQALVTSEAFNALYPDEKTRKDMTEMIIEQAGKKKETEITKQREQR